MAGWTVTFDLLGRTENEAAVPPLVAALGASSPAIRAAALRAGLERRAAPVLRAMIDRVDEFGPTELQVFDDWHGRMTTALRDAVTDPDAERAARGFRAAVRFREYDLIPVLVAIVEEPGNRRAAAAAAALVDLADALVHELAAIRDERRRRDPTLARDHAVTALEQSMQRHPQHLRREPLEALLQLAGRDNAAVLRILTDPRNPCFGPLVEVLATSDRAGVVRLLLGWLDDPRPPVAALQTLLRRTDRRTVDAVLKKIGADPAPAVRANLRRIDAIAWLADDALLFDLDEVGQTAAVAAAHASGLKPDRLIEVFERIARRGLPEARRAVLGALAETRGPRAAAIVLRGLDDADPRVRAAALLQLRPRGVPGALATLLTALERGTPVECDAARSQLHEYRFHRYLPAFDLLDDDVRRTTGVLVAKIDPTSVEQLAEELRSSQTKRRVRALEAAAAMGLIDELQDPVTGCAGDDEQAVRIEAARALATARGDWAAQVLRALLDDEAFAVAEAARESLAEAGTAAAAWSSTTWHVGEETRHDH